MTAPATREGAQRRACVVAAEALFPILDVNVERSLRVRLSRRSGLAGGVMDYESTGRVPIVEAFEIGKALNEADQRDFDELINGVRLAMWGKNQ